MLPEDPGEEELARDWTLSEADRAEVLRCRGDDNRRRFAIQLCVSRQYGTFLDSYAGVPVRILNHLNRQLGLQPIPALREPDRDATESGHQQRLREYLNFRTFDEDARRLLEEHLHGRLAQGAWPEDLFDSAVDALRFWRIVAPAASTLERLAASIAATGREEMFARVASRIDDSTRRSLEQVLEVAPGERRSSLFRFKEYPPEASPASLLDYLERHQTLALSGVATIDLSGIPPAVIEHLAQLARRYDAQALKRFPTDTRLAMLACFLSEARKSLLDHLVAMHDQFMTTLARRSRHAFDERHREFRKRARRGIEVVLSAMEILLDPEAADRLAAVYRRIEEPALRSAVEDCREFQRLEDHGLQDELRARYTGLRRYLPSFLELPFHAELGMQPLLAAIEIARELNRERSRTLPPDAPVDFIPTAWYASLYREGSGRVDRPLWEIGLAIAVRDALRSGGLYLPQSRHHISFANLIYDERQWMAERASVYEQLSLFEEQDAVVPALTRQFDDVARQAMRGMEANPFASVINGRLKLHTRDALPVTNEVKALRGLISPAFRASALKICCGMWTRRRTSLGRSGRWAATKHVVRMCTPRFWPRSSPTAQIWALRPWARVRRGLRPTCSSMSRNGFCGRRRLRRRTPRWWTTTMACR